MLVGHEGLPFIHNSWRCQLDGAHVGELAQGTHGGAFCDWDSPIQLCCGQETCLSIDELERKGGLDYVFFWRIRMCFQGGFHN